MRSQLQPRRSIRIIAITSGVLAGIYLVISLLRSEFRGSANMEIMAKEYAAISTPPGARQLGEIRESSKVIVQSISADFTAQSTAADIEQYYERVLLGQGWKRVGAVNEDKSSGRTTRFCKNDFDLVLEIPDSNARPLRYYVGVQWEGGPYYKTGCSTA